jgi:RHS repeat-associated protein
MFSSGVRIHAVVAIGLAAAWIGCSQGDGPSLTKGAPLGKAVQALDPAWTPQSLGPSAWYVASTAPGYAVLSNTHVQQWLDQSGNHRDAHEDTDWARPTLNATGFNNKPTLQFSGSNLLQVDAWGASPPSGTNAGFSVMAVMSLPPSPTTPELTPPQTGGLASWWDPNGGSVVWVGVRARDQQTLPDMLRNHELVWTQPYLGPHDLGSAAHAIVWRYAPETQTLKVTVDGTPSSSWPLPAVDAIAQSPFYIGVTTPLPTDWFTGNLSELVVLPRSATDTEVQSFIEYARDKWGTNLGAWSADPCVDARNQPISAAAYCDDGNPRTYADHCSAGTCAGTFPLAGSPAELSPTAWYHAGPSEVVMPNGQTQVQIWRDRTAHHLDLLEGFAQGRPAYSDHDWATNKPTVHFTGSSAVRRDGWLGTPGGTEAPFTVLAVVQALGNHSAALASWWTRNGLGQVICNVTASSNAPTLDFWRADEQWGNQHYVDTRALATGPHVLAWRYASDVAKITMDGATVSLTNSTPLTAIGATEFLVGAANDVSSSLFAGDISELAVVPSEISDAQLASFENYAQNEWGGLPLRSCALGTDCTGTNEFCDNGVCRTRSCNLSDPFGSMTRVLPGVTSIDGFALSPDGLTGFFSSPEQGADDIYVATRPTVASPFGLLTLVPNVDSSADDASPFLSTDGLRLYFFTRSSGASDLVMSSRGSLGSPFGAPQPIPNVNSAVSDEDPTLSEDEQTLIFASDRPTGDRHLYKALKSSGSFGTPQPISEVNSDNADAQPVLSRDALGLYFRSNRSSPVNDTDGDIWFAQRSSQTQPFGAPVDLTTLNWTGTDFPVALSADGCTLYLSSNREHGASNTNSYELYRAQRQSVPNQVTIQLNVTGAGTGSVGAPFNCAIGNTGTCIVQQTFGNQPIIYASRQARWSGLCSPHGPNPSTDGIIDFAVDGVCNVSFPCTSDSDCQGEQCVGGYCERSGAGGTGFGGSGAGGATGGTGATSAGGTGATSAGGTGATGTGGTSTSGGSTGTGGTGATGTGGTVSSGGTSGSGGSSGGGNAVEYFVDLPHQATRESITIGTYGGPLTLAGLDQIVDASGFGSLSSVETEAGADIGPSSQLQTLWADTPALLRANSHVYGDVDADDPVNIEASAILDGNLNYEELVPIQHLSWTVPFPSNQGAVVVPTGQTASRSAGAFAGVTVNASATLTLSTAGAYTIDGDLMLAPGSVLDVDNRSGSVQIYTRGAFNLEGFIVPRDPTKANVLVGVGADGAVTLDGQFNGILVAPHGDVTLAAPGTGAIFARSLLMQTGVVFGHQPFTPGNFCSSGSACSGLCPCPQGGSCQQIGDCTPDLACQSGTCSCGCDGKACGASDGCGNKCTCSQGTPGCGDDTDCDSGLVCYDGTCEQPTCMLNPLLAGCGSADSPCGVSCTRPTLCDASDANDPLCCTPNCANKHCGDTDLSDGCGGRCLGVCEPQETGCGLDSDCQAGFICRHSTCVPTNPCGLPNLAPPNCGNIDTLCGACPTSEATFPGERDCGPDPATGSIIGTCPGGTFCNHAGHCAPLETTPGIIVQDPDGSTRTVTPPTADPALNFGATPGHFAVSDSGGSNYSIPIEVPPGRAGIEPHLELAYSSTTANGTLGAGWSLDGLSSITRCAQTMAQDGHALPVEGNSGDALCLDGQRLKPIPNTNEFRTEIDTFTRVIAEYPDDGSPNPTSFIAYTKDGRIFHYGDTASSRSKLREPFADSFPLPGGEGGFANFGNINEGGFANVVLLGGSGGTGGTSAGGTTGGSGGSGNADLGVIATWHLSRVEDHAGNYMRVTYRSMVYDGPDFETTSELVPDTITYTGHGETDGDREVVFDYDTNREDQVFGWRPGGEAFARSFLLDTITVRAQDQTVRSYSLTYETAQHVSRLTQLQECAGNSNQVCVPATTFDYFDEVGFEAPRKFVPDYPGSYFPPEGMARYGLTRHAGSTDLLDTFSVDTYVSTASPWFGLASFAVSFVPWVGSFASEVINSVTEDKVEEQYKAWTFNVATNRADGPTPTCGGSYPPTRQPILSQSSNYFDVCPETIRRPESIPILTRNGQQAIGKNGKPEFATYDTFILYSPLVWMVDIDGDGVQDKIFCNGENSLKYVLANAYLTGSSEPPTHAGAADGLDLATFGDICKIGCTPHPDSLKGSTAHCTADREFSTILDVDGDGTANLVVYDRKLGWAALVYQGGAPSWRTDWFSALTIEPNQNYLVETLDANGDGMRDLLALPKSASAQTPPLVAFNTGVGFSQLALQPDGDASLGTAPKYPAFVTDWDHDGFDELIEPTTASANGDGTVNPWRARKITADGRIVAESIDSLTGGPGTIGDFDGDGNLDALTQLNKAGKHAPDQPFMFFKGTGRHQSLLKTITDGMGHRVDIEYDSAGIPLEERSDALTYAFERTDPTEGSQSICAWPLRCPRESDSSIVTSHTESHYVDQARSQQVVDHQYTYAFEGPMSDMAGYGSLGFLARQTQVRDAAGNVTSDTATLFTEPAPNASGVPYIYTTAGKPHEVTQLSASAEAPLHQNGGVRLMTLTSYDWQEQVSGAGRVYPFLAGRTVQVSDAAIVGSGGLLYQTEETNGTPDAYGNVADETVTSLDGPELNADTGSSMQTHRDIVPTQAQIDAWLVNLPTSVSVTSTGRDGSVRVRTTGYEYYANGFVQFEHRERGGDPSLIRNTEYERDDSGNVRIWTVTDASGDIRQTSTDYDTRNLFPITVTRFSSTSPSQATQLRYDDRFGELVTEVDPNGIDSSKSYDELGILRHTKGPSGETQIDYEPFGNYTTVDGMPIPALYRVTSSKFGGEQVISDYDALGGIVRKQTSGYNDTPVYEEYEYDARHRLSRARRRHLDGHMNQGDVTYGYDDLDRLTGEFYPDGAQVLHDYAFAPSLASENQAWLDGEPGSGPINIERITDANQHATIKTSNRIGQPVRIIDPDGSNTYYFYRAFDALRTIWRDDEDHAINFDQDAYNRQTSITDPARGGEETIAYDGLDEVTFKTDAAGRTVSLVYDDFGRLDHVVDVDGANTGTTQWIYDGDGSQPNTIGRVVETVSSSGQHVTFGYEPPQNGSNRGLLASKTEDLSDPLGAGGGTTRHLVTGFSYDQYSRVQEIDYPVVSGSGVSVQYTYDDNGHTILANDAGDASKVYWQLLDPDEGYRVHTERLGSADCGGTSPGTTTEHKYDPLTGRPNLIKTTCGQSVLQNLSYGYDPAGNLTTRSVPGQTESLGYDSVDRITTLNGVETYTYDPANTGLKTQAGIGTYTYQTGNYNWIQSAGQNNYHHDGVGNIDTRGGPTVPSSSQTITYSTFDLPSHFTTGSLNTDISYDADGLRVIKHNSSGDTTFYAGELYQRVESPGVIKNRNVIFVDGRAVALITTGDDSAPATTRYLYPDHLGSIQVVANANGVVESVRDFGPYGMNRASSSAEFGDVPLGFAGLEEEPELGLINMHGRMYDPSLGQFLQADPVLQQPSGTGLNRFAYVNGSPLTNVDPTGFIGEEWAQMTEVGGAYVFEDDLLMAGGEVGAAAAVPAAAMAPAAALAEVPAAVAAVAPAAADAATTAVNAGVEAASTVGDTISTVLQVGQAVASAAPGLINFVHSVLTPTSVHATNIEVWKGDVSSLGGPMAIGHAGPDVFSPKTGPGATLIPNVSSGSSNAWSGNSYTSSGSSNLRQTVEFTKAVNPTSSPITVFTIPIDPTGKYAGPPTVTTGPMDDGDVPPHTLGDQPESSTKEKLSEGAGKVAQAAVKKVAQSSPPPTTSAGHTMSATKKAWIWAGVLGTYGVGRTIYYCVRNTCKVSLMRLP